MGTCELCGVETGLFDNTKCNEHNYCIGCYNKFALALRNGDFTVEDAKAFNNRVLEYKDLIAKYCTYLKSISSKNKLKLDELLTKTIKLEETMAEELFKKYRAVLTIQEHIFIIKSVMHNMLLYETYGINVKEDFIKDAELDKSSHLATHLIQFYWNMNNVEEALRFNAREYNGSGL